MSYGKSWDKYPIEKGEIWKDKQSGSIVAVSDLTKQLPNFLLKADMIYCDPPWSLGNVNMFNSKAGRDYINNFKEFYDPFFDNIKLIDAKVAYIQVGNQNKGLFIDKLSSIYKYIQIWDIVYYKKYPSVLLRGYNIPEETAEFCFTGIDDALTPSYAIENEKPSCVADLCTGRGLTALAAYKFDVKFSGIELNKRKLAVCIDRCNRKGMRYEKSVS